MAGQSRRFVSWAKFPGGDNREPALSLPGGTSSPPRNLYRDLIRRVAVSRGQYISQPAHAGSSYSSSSVPSSSYSHPSNNSDCTSDTVSTAAATAEFCPHDQELTKIQYISQPAHAGSSYSNSSVPSSSYSHPSNNSDRSGSASAAATAEFCPYDQELTMIVRRMVSDGYARRMANVFGSGCPDRSPLETWFLELDVDWVLQLREEHGLRPELQYRSASSLQELIERWIRALTVTAITMTELVLVVTVNETPAVARFGQASMARMLVFLDAIIPALKREKLRALVDMYVCISSASYRFASYRFTPLPISPEAQTMLNDIGRSLSREVIRLIEAISSTMEQMRTIFEDDNLWPIHIRRGRGEVHRITQLMVNCITFMVKADGSMRNTAQSHDTTNLRRLIDDSVLYLKDLLLRKSELCSDPSLRYLFLLNNLYSVAQLSEPRPGDQWVHTPECKLFMDSYLDVSWGHVVSHIRKTVFKDTCLDVSCGHVLLCIPKTGFHELRQHRKKTSSLAKFKSAFHKTYRAQKFWKVPDPQLRNALRNTIMEMVISDYRCYLKKHPEVEKHVRSSPDVLKEMLGDLFEG